MPLASRLARFRKAGFEGPFYRGLRGKMRFLIESLAWRREFIFAGTRESLASAHPPPPRQLVLTAITAFEALEVFRAQMDAEYYRDYIETWRRPFTWGEQLVIGTAGGRLAAFAWIQRGTAAGFPTYYSRLFETDARILRVGVLPTFRRQGLNSAMMHALLQRLLSEGFRRVYAESHVYNAPSVRTFLTVGFRIVGLITVATIPRQGEFVRWSSPGDVEFRLRELDIRNSTAHRPESAATLGIG